MKWFFLALGIALLLMSWLILQIAKGYTFTYGGYEEWNEEFLDSYNDCCLVTDFISVAPMALGGVGCVLFFFWKFGKSRRRSHQTE